MKVFGYISHWRQEERQPKAQPTPAPELPGEQKKKLTPPPQRENAVPPPLDFPLPPASPGGWELKYDYGLLDLVGDVPGGTEQVPDSGQDTPYGGFELIETLPNNVGREQQEEHR